MTDARALLRPRNRLRTPDAAPRNLAEKCSDCGHSWHGLTCGNSMCVCPTAWINPEGSA